MPRMSAAERRVKLLEAARRVIARDGVAAATTRAVAAEAEMPLASFHYVFESQNEMMRALIMLIAEDEGAVVGIAAHLEPGMSVADALAYSVEHVIENKGQQLAAFEMAHYALRTPGLEDLAAVRAEAGKRVIGRIVDTFVERHGELRVEREVLIEFIMMITDGIAEALVGGDDPELVRRTARAAGPLIETMAWGRLVSGTDAQPEEFMKI